MSNVHDHPELAAGPNPFFDCISPFISYTDLPKTLASSPLTHIKWKAIPANRREPLLNTCDQHFAPSSAVLEAASGLQILLRRSLAQNNPLDPAVRKRCNQIGMACSRDDLRSFENVQGGGMLIAGITGTGKTALLKRALNVFAPKQVVEYGKSDSGGFYSLRQCVYLLVDHPSNGTRGALLKRILHTLDEKLGTTYFEQHKKTTNIDTLLVTVSKLLTLHRVAVLCIDEKQQSTFEDSPWRLDFTLFYLQLMNLGVSIVLSGNPLAFEHIKLFSQVMRRFSVGGICLFEPAVTGQETWWKQHFVPQARKFSIVENWNIDTALRSQFEIENSSGLPGLFVAYHQEVQRSALRRACDTAEVCEQDFQEAQESPRFKHLRSVALSLSSDDFNVANQFIDIPPANRTTKRAPAVTSRPPALMEGRQSTVVPAAQRLLTQFKSKQTREANQLSAQLKAFKSMSPDDIRALGITADLINGFEVQLESLKTSGKKTASPTKSDRKAKQ